MIADQFLQSKNMRKTEPNEIVFDIDDPSEHGTRCISATGIKLVEAGYHIQIWYAEGMKQAHIHLKDISGLEDLTTEQLTAYKKLFIQKFIPKEFWNDKIPDLSMCEKWKDKFHPIAEENKPHHKYKTIKTLRSEFNNDFQNVNDLSIYWEVKKLKQHKPKQLSGNELYKKIASKISIFEIADQFKLDPLGSNKRICPFHADNNPSLSLNEEGLFNCFGCHASGNIIKFYALLKQLDPKFKIEVSQK